MPSYIITSDNFVAGERGDTVTDEELSGCNIPALIAAGHLEPENKPAHHHKPPKADEAASEEQQP